MIKVLIVEDEVSICNLIINLINWIPGELELVGTAPNGVEGYDLIIELQPDLVITDIRMPGITGLELIEKVKLINQDLMFIIISGHKEFDYARNALKFGVEDYLLKPIKRDELNNTLAKIISKHKSRINLMDQEKNIHTQLVQSIQTIRHDRLFQYFYLSDNTTARRLLPLQNGSEFAFKSGSFRVMAVCADLIDPLLADDPNYNLAIEKLCDTILASLEDSTFECEYAFKGTTAFFILNYNPEINLVKKINSEIIDLVINHEYKYDFLKFCLSIGTDVQQLSEIDRSERTAQLAIEYRIDHPEISFINFDDLKANEQPQAVLSEKEKQDYIRLISSLNSKGAHQWLELYFQRIQTSEKLLMNLLYFESYNLLNIMQNTLKSSGLIAADADQNKYELISQRIRSTRDSKRIVDSLIHFIETEIETIFASQEQRESQPIKFCKQYIQEHYKEQITLDQIARELFLNPVYLGALFKSKTGTSFTNWLLSVRIDHAKELLKSTRFSIYEVAEQVGYSDAKHFSRLFQKHEGIKPIEFRKLYS